MVRNRIFISYSYRDKKFFEELRVWLKPWRDRCLHDVWTDQDIQPGQDWHREIQKAVDSTAVAVLLTSHYFMASDYIREHEVPQFLQACEEGKLALAYLHLRPRADLPFTVSMDNGVIRQIKLSKYQSLNDPKKPLESQSKPDQNALFNEAVLTIHELYEQ